MSSNTIDEKVVSMQFDNRNFEENVSATLVSLDELKKALKFDDSSKGLESINEAAKKIDLSSIGDSVDEIAGKFDSLTGVASSALSALSSTCLNAASSLSSSVYSMIFGGGKTRALNIEQAQFQLKGLGMDVEQVMKDCDYAVADTAYTLDSAAKAAAQFGASGVKAGDEMATSLRAISGVAAMTSSEYDDIANIFARIAGNNRVYAIDLQSFSARGLNAAATLAESLGTTEANVRDMVSKGKIDFKTFYTAMDEAFGEHAKAANETFSGAMANVRAAFAKIGADFWTPMLEHLTDVLNAIRPVINAFRAAIAPATEAVTDFAGVCCDKLASALNNLASGNTIIGKLASSLGKSSGYDDFIKTVNDAGVATEDFEKKLIEVGNKHDVAVKDMIKSEGSLQAAMESGNISKDLMVEALKEIADEAEEAGVSTEKMSEVLKEYQGVIDKVWNGSYKDGEERVKALTDAGYDYNVIQSLVNKTMGKTKLTLDDLSDVQLKEAGYTEEEIKALKELSKEAKKSGTTLNEAIDSMVSPSAFDLVKDIFSNFATFIGQIGSIISKAFGDIFSDVSGLAGGIMSVLTVFDNLSKYFNISDELADGLTRTLKGLLAVFDLIASTVGGVFVFVFQLAADVLGVFFTVTDDVNTNLFAITGAIGDLIVGFRNFVKSNNLITRSFSAMANLILDVVGSITQFIESLLRLSIVRKGIYSIIDAIRTLGNAIGNYFVNGIQAINDFIDRVKELDGLTINNLATALKDFGENVLGYFFNFQALFDNLKKIPGAIGNGLLSGLSTLLTDVVTFMKNLAQSIVDAVCEVLGIHSPSTVFKEIGENIVKGLLEGLEAGISALADVVRGIADALVNIFHDMDFGQATIVGLFVGLFAVLKEALKIVKSFSSSVAGSVLGISTVFKEVLDIVKNITSPLKGLNKLLGSTSTAVESVGKSLSGYFKAKKNEERMESIYTLAKAVGVLSASFYVLSQIDSDKMWQAAGIITAMTAGVYALAAACSKLDGKEGASLGKLSILVLSIASSGLILSMAVKKLASIDMGKSAAAVTEMIAIIAAIGALIYAYGKLGASSSANINKVGAMILEMSIGFDILASAIKKISKMSIGEVTQGVVVLGICSVLFGAFIALSGLSGAWSNKAGMMILEMSIGFDILASAIKKLSKLSSSDVKQGLGVVTVCSTLFAAFILLSKFAGKNATEAGKMLTKMASAINVLANVIIKISALNQSEVNQGLVFIAACEVLFVAFAGLMKLINPGDMSKASTTFLALSAAIAVLVVTMKLIGTMSTEDLVVGIAVIELLSVFVGTLVGVAGGAGANVGKVGTMLLGLSAALLSLTVSMKLLATMSTGDLVKATACVSALMVFMSLVIAASKFAGENADKAGSMLMKMSVPILAITAAIGLLTLLDTDKVIAATGCISLIMAMFALLLKSTENLGDFKNVLPNVIVLTAVVAALAAVMSSLASLDAAGMLISATSLSILLLSLSGSLAILSSVKSVSTSALAAVGILTAVIAALAIVLYALNDLDPESMLVTVASISTLILSMSAALLALTAVGKFGTAALEGIASLAALIGGIAVLGTAIGGICTMIPQLDEFLNTGIKVLCDIADGLGTFVGELIGGLLAGITDNLPEIGKDLSDFMDSLGPFLKGADGISSDSMQGIKYLADALLTLTGNDLLSSLTSFITGGTSLADFGDQLKPFGEAIKDFSDEVKDVNPETLTAASEAAKTLSEMASSLPKEGGWLSKICGENTSMSDFGEQLKDFGGALADFSEVSGDIDTKAIKQAAKAGSALSEMADSLPNSGGWLANICGDNTMDVFASQLVEFGKGLTEFSDTISDGGGLDIEAIKQAAKAGSALAEMAEAIPNEGGVFGFLLGENSLSGFSENIKDFGNGIKDFSDSVSNGGIDNEAIDAAVKAGKALAEMAKEIPSEGGLLSVFCGNQSMSNFASNIESFGEGIKNFSNEVSGIDASSVDAAVKAGQNISKLANNIEGLDKDWAKGFKSGISDCSSGLKTVANTNISNVDEFIDAVKKIANIKIDTSAITSSAADLKSAINSLMKSLTTSISGKKTDLNSAMKTAVSTLNTPVSDKKKDVTKAAEEMMKAFAEKIKNYKNKVTSAVKTAVSGAAAGARTYRSSMEQAGQYLGQGLVTGMNSKKQSAYEAGVALGKEAAKGVKKGTAENSPSKLTRQYGLYLGEGLIIGMDEMSSAVEKAGNSMGENAAKSISNTISEISDAIDSDIDVNPTITPVLDLSNVNAGAETLSDLLNSSAQIGLLSNAGDISAMFNYNRRNTVGNDEVVSAIKDLKSTIRQGSGDSYTINGVTYDDGSNINDAVKTIVRAARIERRS